MSRRRAHANSHNMVKHMIVNKGDDHYLDKVISDDKLLKNRCAVFRPASRAKVDRFSFRLCLNRHVIRLLNF